MRRIYLTIALLITFSLSTSTDLLAQNNWMSLFNGQSLQGWKASENPETFSVENGTIVVAGPRAHLFYVGEVNDHAFKNFEFKADVKNHAWF